uniref:Uncharacterized protein n=1 Tax=Anguilla anguilla TaxID=7936 RepID=A0A0E9QTF1_ANGAN
MCFWEMAVTARVENLRILYFSVFGLYLQTLLYTSP